MSGAPRPPALFAMESHQLVAELFSADALCDLARVVALDDEVLTPGSTVSASSADIEILITGWGAPSLDERVLARWPRLRAVVHSAGSVKRLVTPAVWERGIRVSSAARANAVPVA